MGDIWELPSPDEDLQAGIGQGTRFGWFCFNLWRDVMYDKGIAECCRNAIKKCATCIRSLLGSNEPGNNLSFLFFDSGTSVLIFKGHSESLAQARERWNPFLGFPCRPSSASLLPASASLVNLLAGGDALKLRKVPTALWTIGCWECNIICFMSLRERKPCLLEILSRAGILQHDCIFLLLKGGERNPWEAAVRERWMVMLQHWIKTVKLGLFKPSCV